MVIPHWSAISIFRLGLLTMILMLLVMYFRFTSTSEYQGKTLETNQVLWLGEKTPLPAYSFVVGIENVKIVASDKLLTQKEFGSKWELSSSPSSPRAKVAFLATDRRSYGAFYPGNSGAMILVDDIDKEPHGTSQKPIDTVPYIANTDMVFAPAWKQRQIEYFSDLYTLYHVEADPPRFKKLDFPTQSGEAVFAIKSVDKGAMVASIPKSRGSVSIHFIPSNGTPIEKLFHKEIFTGARPKGLFMNDDILVLVDDEVKIINWKLPKAKITVVHPILPIEDSQHGWNLASFRGTQALIWHSRKLYLLDLTNGNYNAILDVHSTDMVIVDVMYFPELRNAICVLIGRPNRENSQKTGQYLLYGYLEKIVSTQTNPVVFE